MGKRNIYPSFPGVKDLKYSPVLPAHCTNVWFFGKDVDRSCRNRRDGGKELDVVGSPVFHENYVEVGGDCAFDTGQIDTPEMAVMALFRLQTAGAACQIIGNLGGGFGTRMVVIDTSSNIQMAAAYSGTTTIQSQLTPSGLATAPFPWRFCIGKAGALGSAIRDMTTGRADTDANGGGLERAVGSSSMMIGATTGAYAHKFDLAAILTFDADPGDDLCDAEYQRLAVKLFGRVGISA